MNQEIERKFLVISDSWRETADGGTGYRQGYMDSGVRGVTIRVRLAGDRGYLTLKGPSTGISRPELEYEIPAEDAGYMLANFCTGAIVSKVRHILLYHGLRWEIDVFSGANQGLVMAEIELGSETQPFDKPEWLGEEVSFDRRYTNAALSRTPFSSWNQQ